jgi:exodeoxyribonuclease VII small subunit
LAVKKKTFEQALNELEKINQALSAGELPLEKAVELYAEGVKTAAYCKGILDDAKLKIEELTPKKTVKADDDD